MSASDAPLSLTYADAGVDIDAGNALIDRIKPLAKATHRSGVMGAIGGFGGLFDIGALNYRHPVLVSSTDGVGTKLRIAQLTGRHDTIGIDLVAMCVNDLIVQGAEPLFFLDYFATGKLNVDAAEQVIAGIARGCRESGCTLLGGETAEMPGMYDGEEYDLAGFAVGACEKDQLLPRADIREGDVLLGLASSGLHSNGFSLVRKVMEQRGLRYDARAPFGEGQNYGELFLTPTRLYVRSCLEALKTGGVKGLAHITGGGLPENLPRVLPKNLSAIIDRSAWDIPPVFLWLGEVGGIRLEELLRTFNCGIGMVIIAGARESGEVIDILQAHGETVCRLGHLAARNDGSSPVEFV